MKNSKHEKAKKGYLKFKHEIMWIEQTLKPQLKKMTDEQLENTADIIMDEFKRRIK